MKGNTLAEWVWLEVQAMSPLQRLMLLVAISGVSATTVLGWITSATKLGRMRSILSGVQAELRNTKDDIKKGTQEKLRLRAEIHQIKQDAENSSPEGILRATYKHMCDGDYSEYSETLSHYNLGNSAAAELRVACI